MSCPLAALAIKRFPIVDAFEITLNIFSWPLSFIRDAAVLFKVYTFVMISLFETATIYLRLRPFSLLVFVFSKKYV